jgi:hypothetical protein
MPSRRCRPPSSIAGVITTDPSQSVVRAIAAAIQAAAAGPGGMKRLAGERPRASYAGYMQSGRWLNSETSRSKRQEKVHGKKTKKGPLTE